ncbi:MAG: alpha/beta hydrolase fold domain-containing protein [Acidimicrobiales bacterium]
MLVLHGSGYLICSARTHRGFASRLSQYSGLPAQGHDPQKVVVAGDSAGAHLAVAVALRARREGLPVPAALALFGPLIDPAYRASIADWRTRSQPFDPRAAARRRPVRRRP